MAIRSPRLISMAMAGTVIAGLPGAGGGVFLIQRMTRWNPLVKQLLDGWDGGSRVRCGI
jgi:hypothetical protein